jgi:hypothetical protein
MTLRPTLVLLVLLVLLASLALTACGGGGPLDNPPDIANPQGTSGGKLSFLYFQKCVNPVLQARITSAQGTNSCAGSGCHDTVAGTGGALRVVPGAAEVTDFTQTADAIRATDMYKNYYSSQGVTVVGSPSQSRLVNKPLLQGVLHGGGLIFDNPEDPMVQALRYWISRPVPQGQDEFSTAADTMFTPADPATGACNLQ